MLFTHWKTRSDTTGAHTEMSWSGFVQFVAAPEVAPDKDALEAWSPGRFAGNIRKDENTELVSAIVLDDDSSGLTLDQVAAIWSAFAGIIHTTHSHTPEHPKYRIVLRVSHDMTREEHARVWRHVRDLAVLRGQTLDEKTKNSSRLWFIPSHRDGAPYAWQELDGKPLDVDAILATAEPEPPATAPAPAERAATTSAPDAVRKGAAALFASAWPDFGTRHATKLAIGGALCRDGWSVEDAVAFGLEINRLVQGDAGEFETDIRNSYNRADAHNITGWPTLGTLMDPGVVQAVRDLLNGTSATNARLAELAAKNARNDEAESTKPPEGLGFEYGAWESEPPPIDFLVDGLLPRGCVGMFFGRADALKTWLLYSLGIAVAAGKPWLGRFNVKQSAKVGIVDYETGAGNVRRRLYMLRAARNPRLGAKSFAALKPSDPKFWEALALEGFDLVIVDSLRRANPGADENDSTEAIRPLELAADFSEKTGCSVLFIHHAKKSTSDGWPEFRGSGAIEDQVDCAFAVRKIDVSAERKAVEVRCEKPGDMRTPEPFTVEVAFDDAARLATIRHVEPDATAKDDPRKDSSEALQAAILLDLAQSGAAPGVKALAHRLGKQSDRVGKAVALLVESRKVVKLDDGYQLDDDDKRTARVLAFVKAHGHESRFSTVTRLAAAAHVAPHDVERLLLAHVFVRAIGSDAGGFLPGANWPPTAPNSLAAPAPGF
jgi:hypothetical protein